MRRRRMGRPGLVGTVARTAVVAGTASAVAGGVAHHQNQKFANQAEQEAAEQQAASQQQWEQQQQWAAQQQAAAPPPAAGVTEDSIAKLKELAALKDQGILTDAEFEVQKAKILNA